MKKITLFLSVCGMLGFVACGPSAEEKAQAEKLRLDSIAAVETARLDSIANAEKLVQEAMAAAQMATEDSLKNVAMQDSLNALNAKLAKATSKPKTTKKPAVSSSTGLPLKATLTEEEKKLPPATQEKILKVRQKMLDSQNKK